MSTRLLRPATVISAATVAASLFLASPAWAHVTVHPSSLPAGSSDVELTFRVPDERDNAQTVKLQVFFPSDLPLLTVEVLPVPGWTTKVDTRQLAEPVQTDDGPVSQVVSDVTWTATTGGIAPGQYEDFAVAVGRVPNTPGAAVFKSLQTYSSGEVVRWIEVASSQDPVPDSPAPVLSVTASSKATASTPATASSDSSGAEALAGAALGVAVVALAGVVVLLFRGRRAGDSGSAAPDGSPEA